MADHVQTLRKRLDRMERSQASQPGRPVNQRDRALTEALRAGITALSSVGAKVAPQDRDEHMGRDYIPFGAGWEIQTRGKGSTFRLCWVDPTDKTNFERYAVCDSYLHEPLEKMARDVRAAMIEAQRPAVVFDNNLLLRDGDDKTLDTCKARFVVKSHRDPADLSLGEDFIRYYEALVWANNVGKGANFSEVPDAMKARCITIALRDFIEQGKISIVLPQRDGPTNFVAEAVKRGAQPYKTGAEGMMKYGRASPLVPFSGGKATGVENLPRVGEVACTMYVARPPVLKPGDQIAPLHMGHGRKMFDDLDGIETRAIGETTWFDARALIDAYGFNFSTHEYRVKP